MISTWPAFTIACAFAACTSVVWKPAAHAAPADATSSCKSLDAVVRVTWDGARAQTVSGVVTRVRFPRSADVATAPEDGSAKASVELLAGTSGGLFDALVKDSDGDGATDLLSVGLITAGIGPGPFARVHFGCVAGAATPSPADFTCVADVADEAGSVPATCTVSVEAR